MILNSGNLSASRPSRCPLRMLALRREVPVVRILKMVVLCDKQDAGHWPFRSLRPKMMSPNWLQNRGGHVQSGYNNHIIDILQLKQCLWARSALRSQSVRAGDWKINAEAQMLPPTASKGLTYHLLSRSGPANPTSCSGTSSRTSSWATR